MQVERFLTQELGMELRKEGRSWLTRCPKCDRLDKMSVDSETCQFRCFVCEFQGNAYTLMKELTPYNNDEIWRRLAVYGLDSQDGSESPRKKQQAKASIKGDVYRNATDDELAQLAKAKNVSVRALSKLGVLVERKKPEIAVLPMHRRDMKQPCGGIRVRLDGKPCWYTDKQGKIHAEPGDDRKPVKYPMIKDGLVGLLGSKWLKNEQANTILLCEGFKDMLAAIQAGYVACTFGGCGNFAEDCAWQFDNKTVIIAFDNDRAGQHHAPRQAERLYLYAKEVLIVPPWCDVKEKDGEDVHDYLTERTEA